MTVAGSPMLAPELRALAEAAAARDLAERAFDVARRRAAAAGFPQEEIAKVTGVRQATVSRALKKPQPDPSVTAAYEAVDRYVVGELDMDGLVQALRGLGERVAAPALGRGIARGVLPVDMLAVVFPVQPGLVGVITEVERWLQVDFVHDAVMDAARLRVPGWEDLVVRERQLAHDDEAGLLQLAADVDRALAG